MVTIGKCKNFHSILQEAAARVLYKARHVSGDSNGDIATLHVRMAALAEETDLSRGEYAV